MIKVLFAAPDVRWAQYERPLRDAFRGRDLSVDLSRDHVAEDVDYIVYAPASGLTDFAPFSRLKAVLNMWAGVEDVIGNPTLKVPLARMVDPGLTEGMVEWVTGHVLRYHLGIDRTVATQSGVWDRHIPPLARERKVAVLGLGQLGRAVAEALAALNFNVVGWARRERQIPGISCHYGEAELEAVLAQAEILVLLLPSTPETANTLNAHTMAMMPRGAFVLNPGRGALIDDTALLAALDDGQIAHATLDVFRQEPLPPDHPFWAHPRITVTPHIAADTRPATAAHVIAENISRGEAGEDFLNLVDRAAGY
ncbi:MAG: glyoxylate/hydroxypyruvate reductase A [Pseudomonadota bacterium]